MASSLSGPTKANKPKFLDQIRQLMRLRHYSRRTEEAYIGWIRRYILFHNKRHPRDLGESDIAKFLSSLAVEGRVAASTQNQALNALLFLSKEVLRRQLGFIGETVRAKRPSKLPVVLSRAEVKSILENLPGQYRLMGQLLYGSGLRLLECLRLRVKDVDLHYLHITVREPKGVSKIWRTDLAACICRTRWRENFQAPPVNGHGNMFFQPNGAQLIRARGSNGGIT
jgi:integrase